jgi:predicted acylesterase/phospholipase RssA
MLDAAMATSSFPAMFPAVAVRNVNNTRTYHLIDGGMVSANPGALAIARAATLFGRDAPVLMVSLGTGDFEAPLPFAQVGQWGLTDWAPRLADVLFDGVNHGVDVAMEELLHSREYFRFQVTLPAGNDGTDDVAPANLDALRQIVADAIAGTTTPDPDRPRTPWPGRFAELARLLGRD